MECKQRQILILESLLKKHIHGNAEEKEIAEKSMRKYGCKRPGEAYKKIKDYRKNKACDKA